MNLVEKILKGKATLADQDEALKDPYTALLFAYNIEEADIEKCQEAACKHPREAYLFALDIPGADIEKCQEAVCVYTYWTYWFAIDVEGANIDQIKKKHPSIADDIDMHFMNKALI